ncbi:MAG: nucleotidyltransferase domain-containing protein, partial [Bacilli bacterium]|nr:nucleotidyltransferase domain-containing protein [Bacilli bacterium]
METKCLIQRFKDENKIMQNEYVAGMIVYGSRVNNCNSESSDLDVFLVSLGNNSYRASKKLNDIRIDMNIISLNHIFDLIDQDYEENASYYPSVFNTGLVEKNDDGIVDYIKDRVNNCEVEKIHKRSIHIYERIELGNLYMSLLNNSRDINFDDYLYFNLLDKLRTN